MPWLVPSSCVRSPSPVTGKRQHPEVWVYHPATLSSCVYLYTSLAQAPDCVCVVLLGLGHFRHRALSKGDGAVCGARAFRHRTCGLCAGGDLRGVVHRFALLFRGALQRRSWLSVVGACVQDTAKHGEAHEHSRHMQGTTF